MPTTTASRAARLQGVDAARGTALLGMVAIHVLPGQADDGSLTLVEQLASGRSAATFAVLAGVGLALGSQRGGPGGWGVRERLALLLRAALLGGVGLALGLLDSGVAVILAYYALLFVLVQPFLTWTPRRLMVLALGVALVVPVASQAVRDLLPDRDVDNPDPSRLADPGPLLSELALTGYYPAAAWVAYLLLGLGVGRLALQRTRTATGVAVAGAGLLVAAAGVSRLLLGPFGGADELGPAAVLDRGFFGNVPTDSRWWLAVDAPHSTTPLDLIGTAGAALLVLGAGLLLARRAGLLLAPLAAAGSMPLSLYSAHVLLLGLTDTDDPGRYYVVQVVVGLAAALAWRRLVGRGPLEAVLALLSRAVTGRRSA